MTIIVTGAAGFIGMHVARRLLARGERVVGIDNFNAYYDRALKEARAAELTGSAGFTMHRVDISDQDRIVSIFRETGARRVVHLAAQAGVRYSIENPFAYERSNLAGHLAILEACRHQGDFEHLVYASSSSVYGERPNSSSGFQEGDPSELPVSLYAATKRAGELMSASYTTLYGLRQSGLRFFTVYGPWGRPDMAYFKFTKSILEGKPIEVYGEGRIARDFTYIEDIVDGIVGVLDRPPVAPENRIYNIGDSRPVGLMTMIEILETALGREAVKQFRPMQAGDVSHTFADISRLESLIGYRPKVSIEDGLPQFVAWYRNYFDR